MNFNEKFKGQTQSIILFLLLDGDRHTDELKEIIDDKFNEVKIGTLYSIIARLKTQGLISEYRASSFDGSRRKYYKITKTGLDLYNNEYKSLFSGITQAPYKSLNEDKQEEKVETNVVKEEVQESPTQDNVKPQEENTYAKYVKKVEEYKQLEIDFSKISIETDTFDEDEEEILKETQNYVKVEEKKEEPITQPQKVEEDIDYDNVHTSNYEYKNVLSALFPKKSQEKVEFVDDSQNFDEIAQTTDITPAYNKNLTNYNTLYEVSEQENIKIRSSVDTNRYQGSKILVNKLRFHASIVVSALAFIEYFLLVLILGKSVEFDSSKLLTIAIIFGALTVTTGIIYVFKHSYSVKDLPKLINSLEIAIIIAIAIIIISLCVSSIKGIDLYNLNEMFNGIIFPSIIAINCPIYVAIVHFMSKLELYQTI